MPLTRGRILGYDPAHMTFKFTMMHEAKIIDCEISSAALDHLADEKGTRPGEREAQFSRLRDTIERLTSETFDEGDVAKGKTVRIFQKHIRTR
jgi:hypothetical protein